MTPEQKQELANRAVEAITEKMPGWLDLAKVSPGAALRNAFLDGVQWCATTAIIERETS